jgi:hypothetical protein
MAAAATTSNTATFQSSCTSPRPKWTCTWAATTSNASIVIPPKITRLKAACCDNYTIDKAEQPACTDCHAETPHEDQRLNSHTVSVACQTCHIPYMATKDPTKTIWDWSTSGQDRGEDHFTYLKIKGDFEYESNLLPVYLWYNGNNDYRYLLGDPINPDGPTMINQPSGSIKDKNAKIYPFKLHVAIQPYDTGYNYLLAPITAGPDGYWTNFDWE